MSHATHLRTLEASGLVSLANLLPEVEYLFRHTLIQEAAYGSLLKSDRQDLHRITGSVMEEMYQDHEEDIAPILAQHFYAAGDYERSLKYFSVSGDKAMTIYALLEAIEHYKFALDIAKRIPIREKILKHLFIQLGNAYELNAQYVKALENYRAMEALAFETHDESMKVAAIVLQAKVYATPSAVHDPDKVQALSNQALELAIQNDDKAAQARIHWILCLVHARTSKYMESIVHGEKALELARELDHNELLAYTLHDISQSYASTNQFEKGYEALRESQSLWRKMDNLVMLVDSLSTMIVFNYFKGEHDQALKIFKDAATLSESIGNLWGQAYCRMYIGSIYFDRGHLEEGLQIMKNCLELATEAGFIVPLIQTQAELGMLYAYLGDSERGLATIDVVLKNSNQEMVSWKAWAKTNKARIHIQRNEFEKTRTILLDAETDLERSGFLFFARMYLQGIYCELALAEKDYPRALELSQSFEEHVSSDIRIFTPWLYYLRGVTFLETGQLQESRDTLSKALFEADKMQMRRITWQIQIALAEVADRMDQTDEARQFRTQAKDTINYIVAHISNEEYRASFLNRPDVITV